MSKTPDEIKKGLECCTHNNCNDCPYRDKRVGCRPYRNADALALIQQLEVDKKQLEGVLTHMNQLRDAAAGRALKMEERVHQLEAERDALINDIRREGGLCALCEHRGVRACEEPCRSCNALRISNESKWQWRGVQKEDGNA